MTRQHFIIILIIFLPSLVSATFGELETLRNFTFQCNLTKPARNDATFPSFSNIDSLRFIVSHRVLHELTTRAVAIFLREIMDFNKPIKFDKYPDDYWAKAMHSKHVKNETYKEDKIIDAHYFFDLMDGNNVNMGVWQTAENREYVDEASMHEGNSISTDIFRHGLYVPENLMQSKEKVSYKNFISTDGSYKNIIKRYDLKGDSHIKPFFDNTLPSSMENVTHINVENGVYIPKHCISTTEPCGIVLTSHYLDNYFFIRIIETFKLKLEMYFMGDELKNTINNLSHIIERNHLNKSFLVLHWTPSEIINGNSKFSSVEVPPCGLLKEKNSNISCKFDVNIVTIMYGDELTKSSPFMVKILNNIKFKPLQELIDRYEGKFSEIRTLLKTKSQKFSGINEHNEVELENIYNQIACDYLKNNTEYYKEKNKNNPEFHVWFEKPENVSIIIGGMYPEDDSGQEYDGIQSALAMAQSDLENYDGLPYGIKIESKDDQLECKPDLALKSFISHFIDKTRMIGVLGPACSEAIEPIAIISKHYKMTAITYSAEGISFADRTNYPYFFRTIGENTQYEIVFAKIFETFRWERIAAITEDGQKYTEYITNMGSKYDHFKIIVDKKFPREAKQLEHFEKLLKELRDTYRARIIICDVHDHRLMKPIMCMARKLGMTAKEGFVWFLPVYISLKMNEPSLYDINEECSMEYMRDILNGHLALSYANLGKGDDRIASGQTVDEWKKNYLKTRRYNQKYNNLTQISPADYAPFVYDSIWVYAKALKVLSETASPDSETKFWYLKNLDNEKTYEKITQIISNLSFTGVSGKIEFNKAGSRYTDINILQWINNDFVQVGTYKPEIIDKDSTGGVLTMYKGENKIKWLKGGLNPPDDGRESCALEFLSQIFGIECNTVNTILISILCVLIILACSGMSFLFWKQKYAKKLEKSAQIMMNYGRVVNGIELSRWEIPRENVILNRRIGEGAFGTVYGGEALIKEDEGWTPVAIKTLKSGANAEARLDFLAESEIMKRFEHKNIVKLLAVCLQKEPLYMLGEFMLYGDLKTFLLARRHLVDDKIHDDNNDISPKRLTLMALDVARGLSYLASLNFVHRDIACRNCLINAQRICKIGDFGMARSTSEKEYYRFTRKGMLPVRWMSPESISLGLFTHASDVWAFGVFLYEVVTLGAFPFQGLTNNQVFDLVKSGSSVKIPTKCKPQLKALMSSCFSIDPKKRPGASTIVEFISNHPRMVTPCMMDAPKPNLNEQVNLLGSDNEDLEFDQLAETRERSHTPAATIHVDFLRTSASSSALQTQNYRINQEFEYLDMKLPRRMNGISDYPDLTATLPNGNYDPIQPLLHRRTEISKSTLSLLKMYVPMCGKNRNRSSPEECTTTI